MRVLVIAYHFPPSVVVGALRWERLVHLLAAKGISFDVITLEPNQLQRSDPKRQERLPSGIRVFGVEQTTPLASQAWNWLAKSTKALRASRSSVEARPKSASQVASVPAAGPASTGSTGSLRKRVNAQLHVGEEMAWARAAADAGIALSREQSYDVVVTSGPPHHVHMAGYFVSRATGVPHIPDFRDPWRLAESAHPDLDEAFIARSDREKEAAMVQNASSVVMNTEAAALAMQATYPEHAKKIVAIMNGSDPEDRIESPQRDRFTMLYAGSLYLQRDPRVLFRACAPIVKDLGLAPHQFALQFLGPVDRYDGRPVVDLAREYGLADHVIMGGMVPRIEALRASAAATQLVCLPDGQRLTIPAKLFEYVQLDAWLLAFADDDSAMAMALRGTDADVVRPGDTQAAEQSIRRRWEMFATGKRPSAIGADGRFLRETQAARFHTLLVSAREARS